MRKAVIQRQEARYPMMALGIFLSVILAAILWVVFTPVNIIVNANRGLYEISQNGTVRISFHAGETPAMKVRVFGLLVRSQRREVSKRSANDKEAGKGLRLTKSLDAWMHLLSGVLKSLHCRRFICSIDFDDVALNAQLFPMAYLTAGQSIALNINFQKHYQLDVWIQARIYRMLWAAIRFYLTK